ncbi:hypothetical protein [Microbacterium sp. A20]|nr:hypothetical protein [Microbacterium sp. A20]
MRLIRERLQLRLHWLVAGAVLAVIVLIGLLIVGVTMESAPITFMAGGGIAAAGLAWGIGYATITLQRLRLTRIVE